MIIIWFFAYSGIYMRSATGINHTVSAPLSYDYLMSIVMVHWCSKKRPSQALAHTRGKRLTLWGLDSVHYRTSRSHFHNKIPTLKVKVSQPANQKLGALELPVVQLCHASQAVPLVGTQTSPATDLLPLQHLPGPPAVGHLTHRNKILLLLIY